MNIITNYSKIQPINDRMEEFATKLLTTISDREGVIIVTNAPHQAKVCVYVHDGNRVIQIDYRFLKRDCIINIVTASVYSSDPTEYPNYISYVPEPISDYLNNITGIVFWSDFINPYGKSDEELAFDCDWRLRNVFGV